jgi:hypothetical protein
METTEDSNEIRRKNFWIEVNQAYANLRADSVAWREILEERELWGQTLLDGLEGE